MAQRKRISTDIDSGVPATIRKPGAAAKRTRSAVGHARGPFTRHGIAIDVASRPAGGH